MDTSKAKPVLSVTYAGLSTHGPRIMTVEELIAELQDPGSFTQDSLRVMAKTFGGAPAEVMTVSVRLMTEDRLRNMPDWPPMGDEPESRSAAERTVQKYKAYLGEE